MTRRTSFRTALVAGLAALTTTAAAQPASAAKNMEFGLQDDAALLYQYDGPRGPALDSARALGVTRLRVNLIWARTMPNKESRTKRPPHRIHYTFGQWDDLIDAAAARGMRVQLTLTGPAPAWATGNHKTGIYKPSPKRFGTWVKAVAKHFKGRVDIYAIWNEPNLVAWLAPKSTSARQYRALYQAAYKSVRASDHRAKILIGETSPFSTSRAARPIQWLRSMACVDKHYKKQRGSRCKGTLIADGYAHHPYEFKHKPSYHYPGTDNATTGTIKHLTTALSKLRRARALKPHHGSTMPLYLTEYGYLARGKRAQPETRRARYLVDGFTLMQKNRSVKQVIQYLLIQPPESQPGAFFATGITSTALAPLKSYLALQKYAKSAAKKHRIKRVRGPLHLTARRK